MRDIGSRIGRYRLRRYAPARRLNPSWLRWGMIGLGMWLLWAAAVSDHSLYRIWRLSREQKASRAELGRVQREYARLEAQDESPRAKRELAERRLREESGMAKPGEIIYRIRRDVPDSTTRR